MTSERRPLPVWLIVGCGCLVAAISFGPRSAVGLFQDPMLAATDWSRTQFGLAIAIQNLCWGLGQPVFGAVADRFGAWRTLALGGVIYAVGLVMMSWTDSVAWLHLGGGVLVGTGVACSSFGIVLSVFARNVTPESRSFVFGLGTAAGSFGMFVFAPLSVAFIERFGWSDALVWLSVIVLAIPVLAIPLRGSARESGIGSGEVQQTVSEALGQAFGHFSYLLLVSGFFVCGFQVAFITAHFPAYLADIGIDAVYAGYAIGLIGLFNVFGSLASGVIGQRVSKPLLLAWIYVGRSLVVTAFLLVPPTPLTVIAFAIAMGLLWLSTVAPTNALVAVMFGTRHLGLLSGIVFFSHQIGSFLGVWLGGYLRDVTGSFEPVWWFGVALGLLAAIVHWPIREAAAPRELATAG